MEHLRCVVERITYQNADNGYTVLKCAVKNYSDLVTVVGTMPDTHVGSVLSLEGMWKMDAKYGRQFLVEKFEETLPATVYGIEKYLGSGLVRPEWVGKTLKELDFRRSYNMNIILVKEDGRSIDHIPPYNKSDSTHNDQKRSIQHHQKIGMVRNQTVRTHNVETGITKC